MALLKRFLRFTIPSIVSMLIFSLYTIVDGIFVAQGVGDHALAAVNLSMPFTSLVFATGVVLAAGTATVISISLGQGDLEGARNTFCQNLCVTALVSLALGGIALLFLEPVAHLLGATAATLTYVKEYVGTIAVFAVFFTISYNLEVQVKANGAPQISAVGVLSCGLMNVLLDYVFVMHFHWGVWGAALATGLAQVTSTTVFLVYFLTHRQRLRLGRFRRNLGIYRRILPLGVPEGLSELSNGLVIFLFNRVILAVLGEDGVVSYTIISYVNTLVLMAMIGSSQGLQPLVAFHHGAGEEDICRRLLRCGIGLVTVLSLFSFALVQLGAGAIVDLFLERSSPLFAASVHALRAYGWVFLIYGFNVLFAGYFTANERPGRAMVISLGRSLVLPAVCLVVLSALFGGEGIWRSALVAEALCLCVTLTFALSLRREH